MYPCDSRRLRAFKYSSGVSVRTSWQCTFLFRRGHRTTKTPYPLPKNVVSVTATIFWPWLVDWCVGALSSCRCTHWILWWCFRASWRKVCLCQTYSCQSFLRKDVRSVFGTNALLHDTHLNRCLSRTKPFFTTAPEGHFGHFFWTHSENIKNYPVIIAQNANFIYTKC